MYDSTFQREFLVRLAEVCEAMRAHKRAVDQVIGEFKDCSERSKKTLAASYDTLDRLSRFAEERPRT